jgi:hypothetical protein
MEAERNHTNGEDISHGAICKTLSDIYSRKNADYGDSFSKSRKEFSNATLVRIFDKYNRLKTLYQQGYEPKINESIEDTLMDLANYCIMEIMEQRRGN